MINNDKIYCPSCGEVSNSEATFCFNCGFKLKNNDIKEDITQYKNAGLEDKRNIKFAGNIVKCPNCGDLVKPYTLSCESCGFDYRGSTIPTALKILSEEIKRNTKYQKQGFIKQMKGQWGIISVEEQKQLDTVNNFLIGNTLEEILNLYFFAYNNIDFSAYDISISEASFKKKMNYAWESKLETCYNKLLISEINQEMLTRVNIVQDKFIKKKKNAKWKTCKMIGYLWIGIFVLYILLYFITIVL